MTKRPANVLGNAEGEHPRVVCGQALVTSLRGEYTELRNHEVRETTADGLCFLHAAMQQLGIDDPSSEWEVAMAVIQSLAANREKWKLYLEQDEEHHRERMEALDDFGLESVLISRRLGDVDLRSFAYLLDRCCGVMDNDWGYPRLYCDHVFIQEFLNWCGGSLLLVALDPKVTRMSASGTVTHSDCVFKMVHYTDQPEHFNAVCPRVWDEHGPMALMRERILVKLREFGGSAYWCTQSLNPYLIAEEILPVLEPFSDSDDVESVSSEEEDSPAASAAPRLEAPQSSRVWWSLRRPTKKSTPDTTRTGAQDARGAKSASAGKVTAAAGEVREENGASAAEGRVVPRALPSSESPHPRALQEGRFAEIASQWHGWVVVPEFIGGVRTTRKLLDSGVWLPKKHCFWQGCQWTGSNNAERWCHVRSKHWSKVLADAVAYYHNGLPLNRRLETVMNQVAGLIMRRGAPLSCVSIDRRSLHNLWSALAPEDSVENVVCFSCACSHPMVRPLRGSRISYHPAFEKKGKFLGLEITQVEDFFGRTTYLRKYGRRVVKGSMTDLSVSPWQEELEVWEVGVWLTVQVPHWLQRRRPMC